MSLFAKNMLRGFSMHKNPVGLDEPNKNVILMGNDAVARGALESGVKVAAAYPGTPSSEIVGTLSKVGPDYGLHVEWSTNEKVSFEVAAGAAYSGVRAFCATKHLGMNWLSDALLVVAYTGIKGGLVLVCADDPHPFSSQNAEDTRYYAMLAKIPCLEPSNVEEAKEFVKEGYKISEDLQLPVLVRITPRISHARAQVTLNEIIRSKDKAEFKKDYDRFVMIAPHARKRHVWLNEQNQKALKMFDDFKYNEFKFSGKEKVGIISSGVTVQYTKEAIDELNLKDVAFLKLTTTHPIPERQIKQMLNTVEKVIVIEELEPIIENRVKALASEIKSSAEIFGKYTGHFKRQQEYNYDIVTEAIADIFDLPLPKFDHPKEIEDLAIRRIPSLCAGCAHRASYYAIKKALKKIDSRGIVTGDRGCYNQGTHPPLSAIDTCICMGGGIGIGNGVVQSGTDQTVVAVTGDSTFLHAGVPGLLNIVHNNANLTVGILDNSLTCMTGHQPNPNTGINAMGEKTKDIDLVNIVKACGVDFVKVVDPYNLDETQKAFEEALSFDGPSVVICKRACAIEVERAAKRGNIEFIPFQVDPEACNGCKRCINLLGCPSMVWDNKKVKIDPASCIGCGVCAQVCNRNAIKKEGGS